MTGYYCEKCNRISAERKCAACGKSLSVNTFRNVWRVIRVPASDGLIWKKVLLYLLVLVVLVFLVVLLGGVFSGHADSALSSNVIPFILGVFPVGIVIVFLVLILQGRENIWYTLEAEGAHMQIWYRTSHIHSWARLSAYTADSACPQPDGTVLTPQEERFLSWDDLAAFKVQPKFGRIWLYHQGKMAPLILRIPAEDFETAEAMIRKMCKKKQVKEYK